MNEEMKLQIAYEISKVFGKRDVLIEWDKDEEFEGWFDILCNYFDYGDLKAIKKISDDIYIGGVYIDRETYKIDIRCHYNSNNIENEH